MAVFAGPDAFTGTAVQELSAYNAAWSKQSGYTTDGNIGANGQYAVNNDGSNIAVYQHSGSPASADYYVSADIAKLAGTTDPTMGITGRAQSGASTFYALWYTHASTQLRLYKYVSSTPTQLGSSYSLILTSTPKTIQLRMVGDQISGYLDGALVIGPVTDTAITTAGKAGVFLLAMRQTGVFDSGSLDNFTGEDAAPPGFTLTADSGAFSLTGQTAGLLFNRSLTADQGAYALTGQDVTLTKATPGAFVLTADTGQYIWTGEEALADYAMNGGQGSYALSGQDVTFTRGFPQAYTLTADAGSYTFNGQNARLNWSGAPIVPNRQIGIYMGIRIGL